MKANKARRVAIEIMDEFEELLDREGRKEEACIYGTEYYELEDVVTDILVEETRPRRRR